MKLSISNIAWSASNDEKMYMFLKEQGYEGIEIAPTRIFPNAPYDHISEAKDWSNKLFQKYGLTISSMQSIWYGRTERIFGGNEERQVLIEYTKKAIDFASAIGCNNLVFGCPRNRNIPQGMSKEEANEIAVPFFKELGEYADSKNTVLALEANPPIYNTNFINDTMSAMELISRVDSKGFLLNLDVGTMIANEEDVKELEANTFLINHVHISEPNLLPIAERKLHLSLIELLKKEGYKRFISIEMGKPDALEIVERTIDYISNL